MNEDSTFSKYLDEIGRCRLLTIEEEQALSAKIARGDMRAVGKLVEANLRFVVKQATAYRGKGVGLDDLVSEGNLGLMDAALKYDGTRGARFVSYAAPFVRRKMEQAIEKLATPAAPADKRGGRPAAGRPQLSVDAPLGGRKNMSLLSVLVNPNAPIADERVYSEAVEHAVERALKTLNGREAQVVCRFYGLGCEYETMAEIGEDLSLKRERVRQIRNRAVRRLRKAFRSSLAELRQRN